MNRIWSFKIDNTVSICKGLWHLQLSFRWVLHRTPAAEKVILILCRGKCFKGSLVSCLTLEACFWPLMWHLCWRNCGEMRLQEGGRNYWSENRKAGASLTGTRDILSGVFICPWLSSRSSKLPLPLCHYTFLFLAGTGTASGTQNLWLTNANFV